MLKSRKNLNGSQPVMMNMTGEEFLTLIERKTSNNKTDTVPELMEAFEGIPEGMNVGDYMQQLIRERTASADDIDELFPEQREVTEPLER